MSKKAALKIASFTLILGILLFAVSPVMTHSATDMAGARYIVGFYEEPENSLDAVYIGASNVFSFWAAPVAWKHYGITVYPFAGANFGSVATKYLISEARKTQPNALYIVGISANSFNLEAMPDSAVHYIADYMPASVNKLQLVQKLLDLKELDWSNRIEYYFPLVRYHSRWSELEEGDFLNEFTHLKGGDTSPSRLSKVIDASENYHITEEREALSNFQKEYVEDLFQYCESEQVNVLFVISNMIVVNESRLAQLNTFCDLCEEHGFPVLDLTKRMDEIGLDLTRDYGDLAHVNIHGMMKSTDYLSQYLIENYGFEDKRDDPAYSDWDEAYDEYVPVMSRYSLDFEYTNADRDYCLAAPELSKCSVKGTTLTLTWNAAEGASGYCIYRKTEDSGWVSIAIVDAETLSYQDEDCEVDKTYTYTVASYQERGGTPYWGNYDFDGLSGTVCSA